MFLHDLTCEVRVVCQQLQICSVITNLSFLVLNVQRCVFNGSRMKFIRLITFTFSFLSERQGQHSNTKVMQVGQK